MLINRSSTLVIDASITAARSLSGGVGNLSRIESSYGVVLPVNIEELSKNNCSSGCCTGIDQRRENESDFPSNSHLCFISVVAL